MSTDLGLSLYDVALWRYWPSRSFPIVEDIEADSPLVAALHVMERHKLKRVAYAAVALPDRTIRRWEKGLALVADASYVVPDEEEEEVRL